jgi:hypothetical protein
MNLRTIKRSVQKQNGTRRSQGKGSTGQPKGPARTQSLAEARRAAAKILRTSQAT